jgi:hypothetical protein
MALFVREAIHLAMVVVRPKIVPFEEYRIKAHS